LNKKIEDKRKGKTLPRFNILKRTHLDIVSDEIAAVLADISSFRVTRQLVLLPTSRNL